MTKNKKIGIFGGIAVIAIVIIAFIGLQLNKPAYAFKLDVNPSIEIVSNNFDKVLEVNPQNEDAVEMLKDFKIEDNDLEDTIEDLADLMVLTGYISGGKDNVVMITVNDKNAPSNLVNKLNQAIAAYLENKQIEATILNQSISDELYNQNTGGEVFARRLNELDDILSYEDLSHMSVKELVQIANVRGIAPELLFSQVIAGKSVEGKVQKTGYISETEAREIALGLVNGKIVEFELDDTDDDDDDNPEYEIEIILNGYKYEIELDAYTGNLIKFERDDIDDDHKTSKTSSDSNMTIEKAKQIALDRVGGGTIVDFEFDDNKYEIEIHYNDYEYDIELNAYTGEIIKFEKDDIDDDDNNKSNTGSTSKTTQATVAKSAPKTIQATAKSTPSRISAEKAKQIALDKVGGGTVVEFELDDDNEYEIEIHFNGYEYEVEINAFTGAITEFDKDDIDDDDKYKSSQTKTPKATSAPKTTQATAETSASSSTPSRITAEQAKQIALNKVGGGTIVEFEKDDDEYEVEIHFNGYEYEVEMDLYGRITEFERDEIDN